METMPKTIKAVVPKQINVTDAKAHALLSTRSETASPSVEPLKLKHLETLWLKMTETYGHRWTANFGTKASPDHAWAKHLSGITGQQIANGLGALTERGDPWPPSAPEFRQLCTHVRGMPTEDEAWAEALMGTYTHEAVRIAAEATSTFDLKTAEQGDKVLRQRFERNYAIVMRRAQTGQPLSGRIAEGISHDSARDPRQVQLEHSRKEAEALVLAQGIPANGQSARAMLLAKLNIRRNDHV